MALNLLNGQMLNSSLQRDGVNLSIVNTANATPLIYFDVVGNQVGINTNSPTNAFTINGNASANNFNVSGNVSATGNVIAVANVIGNNAVIATDVSVGGNIAVANFAASGNANAVNISASGNINATSNISAGGNVLANNASITGNTSTANLSVTGTANINNLFATNFSVTGNSTAPNLSVSGNVSANIFLGNNQFITANTTSGNLISNLAINGVDLSLTGVAVTPSITGNVNGNVTIVANGTGVINLANPAVNNTTITSISAGNLVTIGGTGALVIPASGTSTRPAGRPIGSIRFNTDLEDIEVWDGSSWISNTSGGGSPGTITDQQITPDGTSTSYTLNSSATDNGVLVFINGVLQYPGAAYSVSTNTITFAQAPLTNDIIDVRFITYTASVSALANPSGTAFVSTTANSIVELGTSSTVQAYVDANGVFNVDGPGVRLPNYTVATTAAIPTPQAGQVIYVTDGNAGSACLAVWDGSSWKRVALGATISAT